MDGDPVAAKALEKLVPIVPADAITVTASSTYSGEQDVHHLIDGSGMTGMTHDFDGKARTMWQTADHPASSSPARGLPATPAWVRFDFAEPQKIESILIWNDNQARLTDRGFRGTQIFGTSDGATWFPITARDVVELPRASGTSTVGPFTVSGTSAAKPVKSIVIEATAANATTAAVRTDSAQSDSTADTDGQSVKNFPFSGYPKAIPAETR